MAKHYTATRMNQLLFQVTTRMNLKHTVESKKPDMKEYILYDLKFTNRHNKSVTRVTVTFTTKETARGLGGYKGCW